MENDKIPQEMKELGLIDAITSDTKTAEKSMMFNIDENSSLKKNTNIKIDTAPLYGVISKLLIITDVNKMSKLTIEKQKHLSILLTSLSPGIVLYLKIATSLKWLSLHQFRALSASQRSSNTTPDGLCNVAVRPIPPLLHTPFLRFSRSL